VPELRLQGLSAEAAAELLPAGLPAGRRYRVLAEAAGNPLALLELPRVLTDAVREGPLPLTDRLRDAFETQLSTLSEPARTVLLLAAADGTGDLSPILRAAATFGASLADLDEARAAGLVEVSAGTLTFRHSLIRAAVQHAAPLALRRAAHRALAEALDGPGQADRRAWQQAAAAAGPDEEVAAELERVAGSAHDRGGDAGALSWYERAAELSGDPVAKTRRLTLAAEAAAESGDLDLAMALADQGLRLVAPAVRPGTTSPGYEDPLTVARLWQVQANVAFLQGDPGTAHRRLMEASELTAAADRDQAAMLLIEAVHAAWYTGERELAQSVAQLEALDPGKRPLPRLLLRAVAPILGQPADGTDPRSAFAEAQLAAAGNAADLVLISGLGLILGHDRATLQISSDLGRDLRATGRIGLLPSVLFYAGCAQAYSGRHDQARQTVAEGLRLARDNRPAAVGRCPRRAARLAGRGQRRPRALPATGRRGARAGGRPRMEGPVGGRRARPPRPWPRPGRGRACPVGDAGGRAPLLPHPSHAFDA